MVHKAVKVLREMGLDETEVDVASAVWRLKHETEKWGGVEDIMLWYAGGGIGPNILTLLEDTMLELDGAELRMARRGVLGSRWVALLIKIGVDRNSAKKAAVRLSEVMLGGGVVVWKEFMKAVASTHGAHGIDLERGRVPSMSTKDEIRELAISIGVSVTDESSWPTLEAKIVGLGFAQGRRVLEAHYERLGVEAPMGGSIDNVGPLDAVRGALDRAPFTNWKSRQTGKIMLHDWEGRSSLGFAADQGAQGVGRARTPSSVFGFVLSKPKRDETYGAEKERFEEAEKRKAKKQYGALYAGTGLVRTGPGSKYEREEVKLRKLESGGGGSASSDDGDASPEVSSPLTSKPKSAKIVMSDDDDSDRSDQGGVALQRGLGVGSPMV